MQRKRSKACREGQKEQGGAAGLPGAASPGWAGACTLCRVERDAAGRPARVAHLLVCARLLQHVPPCCEPALLTHVLENVQGVCTPAGLALPPAGY